MVNVVCVEGIDRGEIQEVPAVGCPTRRARRSRPTTVLSKRNTNHLDH